MNIIYQILYIDKNILFSYEKSDLQGLENEYYIKKYEYDEKKNKIRCLGNIEIRDVLYELYFKLQIGKLNNEYYLFIDNFQKNFIEMKKILAKPEIEDTKIEIRDEKQLFIHLIDN